MAAMWRDPRPTSVRDVLGAIGDPEPAYTTVMTIMGRLYEKRLLRRRSQGKAYLYEPRISEDEFLAQRARRSIKRFVEDFGDVALAQFAEELERVDTNTRQRLRRLKDSNS